MATCARTYDDGADEPAELITLMSKYPKRFPSGRATESVFAVEGFRENMEVEISENDFVEERCSDDPPRGRPAW